MTRLQIFNAEVCSETVTAGGLRHIDKNTKWNGNWCKQKREERNEVLPLVSAPWLTSLIFSRYDQSAARTLFWTLLVARVDEIWLWGERPRFGQLYASAGQWTAQSTGPGNLSDPAIFRGLYCSKTASVFKYIFASRQFLIPIHFYRILLRYWTCPHYQIVAFWSYSLYYSY